LLYYSGEDSALESGFSQRESRGGTGGKASKRVKIVTDHNTKKDISTMGDSSVQSVVECPPALESDPDAGRLTDKWLDDLSISNRCPLINVLRIHLADDGTHEESAVAQLKTRPDIEDMRLGVTAFETKVVWRHLQKAVNEVSCEVCKKVKGEWTFASPSSTEHPDQSPENFHYGNCYLEQSQTLKPDSVTTLESDESIMQAPPSLPTSLSIGIEFFNKWQSYRQLMLHTVMS
jgi:hypothetical protein